MVRIAIFLVSLIVFSFVIVLPKLALAQVSNTIKQTGPTSEATSGASVITTINTPAKTVPPVEVVVTPAPARVVTTVPTTTTTQLPSTGIPWYAYLLLGLIPVGFKLIKYEEKTAPNQSSYSLWQNRQFKSS